MDIHTFTDTTDRDFADENENELRQLERLASTKINLEKRRDAAIAELVTVDSALSDSSMKIRRGFIRYDASLGATLPATLTDAAPFDRDTGSTIRIHFNAAAATRRANN